MPQTITKAIQEMEQEQLYRLFEDTLLTKCSDRQDIPLSGPIDILQQAQKQLNIIHHLKGIPVSVPIALALDNLLSLTKQGDLMLDGKVVQLLLEMLAYMRQLNESGESTQQQIIKMLDAYCDILAIQQPSAGTAA